MFYVIFFNFFLKFFHYDNIGFYVISKKIVTFAT